MFLVCIRLRWESFHPPFIYIFGFIKHFSISFLLVWELGELHHNYGGYNQESSRSHALEPSYKENKSYFRHHLNLHFTCFTYICCNVSVPAGLTFIINSNTVGTKKECWSCEKSSQKTIKFLWIENVTEHNLVGPPPPNPHT